MPETFESQRLLFRELDPSDDEKMFELDSNPEVHRYLGNNPFISIEESRDYIELVRGQYRTNGIGRMAVIVKETGGFIGWAGLKREHNFNGHEQFYDVGFRLLPQYWGKGYATEAARAFIELGFTKLWLEKINACALTGNAASQKALERSGLQFIENFTLTGKYEGEEAAWYEIQNPYREIPVLESERLLFRALEPSDKEALFALDSDPEVHRYLGNTPVQSMDEIRAAIAMIREQYRTNGVGRMAVILKETGEFLGWAGLKLVRDEVNSNVNYYDLGYRFMQKHWGKGYATESAKVFIEYGFNVMKLPKINAYADAGNTGSRAVLEKVGLKYIESFDDEGVPSVWYEMVNPVRNKK